MEHLSDINVGDAHVDVCAEWFTPFSQPWALGRVWRTFLHIYQLYSRGRSRISPDYKDRRSDLLTASGRAGKGGFGAAVDRWDTHPDPLLDGTLNPSLRGSSLRGCLARREVLGRPGQDALKSAAKNRDRRGILAAQGPDAPKKHT